MTVPADIKAICAAPEIERTELTDSHVTHCHLTAGASGSLRVTSPAGASASIRHSRAAIRGRAPVYSSAYPPDGVIHPASRFVWGNARSVTRIAPSHGSPASDPPGLGAAHVAGSVVTRRGISGLEILGRRTGRRSGSASRTFAALGLAVTAAAAYAAWRGDPARLGSVGISPAALHLISTPARPPEATEPVSVLIPVRHAPDPTVAAVRAALCQQGVGALDIVVLDDGCPHETRMVLRREFGDDPRVRILAAAPLPRGWSPLAHRSHQLAVAARGRVLIFAEPCAPLGPNAVAAATALLRTQHLDLAVLDTGRPAAVAPHATQHPETAPSPGGARDVPRSAQHPQIRNHTGRYHSTRIHPGRFTVAVDADAYWRIGGYRAAAADPDPLALLRTVRRASGRVVVADGRRVIPPALPLAPLAPPVPQAEAEAEWDSMHNTRGSLTDTARRVLAALVGARA